ncbi:AAA family ATPase [Streptomyces solicathayae]|uniref:AAA family ATPase n=1 Tax=Streptomyces solicathayae TaxID=3081768 RepID=A0ABZ0M3X8_9ACTN|nr:AAA family ATPase [Streptomyces sp. HUAS YS2]WOX19894.1 AAA family ATPase [Streptomyces sp. HUAS YS2]WOX26484.1 AAA family ATPase [Streptomyces sp. HUAS YS2]
MKATTALQKQQEERALQRAQLAPMRPEWIYRRQGWNSFTREDIAQPDLADHPPLPTEDERLSDPRLAYHAHLKLVSHQGYDEVLLASFRAVMVNSDRREGILDRVIDAMSGTGKSLLLRAIGRTVQRDIEDRTGGELGAHIPVVHILAPADTDSKVNWVWEIACFLGLNPEPLNENALLRWRSYPDLSVPVNYVLENALTRLLLVDDIQRVQPHQLAPVLHYFDYLRNRLGITTIFCGTGASDIVHEARAIADRHEVAIQRRLTLRATHSPGQQDAQQKDQAHSLLPITWLDPIPFNAQDKESWLQVLAGYEKHLSLHNLNKHALTEHHEYLHNRTGGYFLALSQLICQAATLAILTGTENITRTELDAIHIGRGH